MLKNKRNCSRIGGGVRPYSISRGTRLWLSLILSFICATLLCCAFLLSANGDKSANAAVDPDNAIKYSVTNDSNDKSILKMYRHSASATSIYSFPYSTLRDASTLSSYGSASFDPDSKTATLIKSKVTTDVYHQVCCYVAFNAKITVPAYTEYKVNFSYSIKVIRNINDYRSTSNVGAELFYYGNDYSDANLKDKSENMTFGYKTDEVTSSSSPSGYSLINKYHISAYSSGTTSKTFTYTPASPEASQIPEITMINNTDTAKTYTAYFGFWAYSSSGTSYYNWFTNTVTMTDKLTVTAITPPSVDKTSANYDKNGNVFTFSNLDATRVELQSVNYKDVRNNSSTVTPTIDTAGKCTLINAGEYTFTFKIKDTCGAVWNSTTNDQAPKTIKITINPVTLTAPSGTVTTEYNGSEQSLSTLTSPPNWYDTTYYGNSDIIAIDDKYTDAKDYPVSVTIIDSNYIWSDYSSNPTDVRTFTFSITKKELAVTFEEDSVNGNLVAKYDESDLCDRDKAGDKKPVLITKYSKDGKLDSALDAPNGLGNWYAIAVLQNEDKCNYSVNARETFGATKTKVAYPTLNSLSSSSQSYNNSSRTFMFKGYDSELMEYEVPEGAESFDGTTLIAKNAGTYTIVYKLKDESLYEWNGNTTLTVEITKYVLGIVPDDNETEWISGTETELVFLAAPLPGDSVQLAAKLSKDGGEGEDIDIVDNGDGTHTVTIPSIYLAGEYTLTVKVAEGENYVSDEEVYEFTIQGETFDLDESNIKWLVNGKAYPINLDEEGYLNLEYTGSDVTFTVDIRAYAYLRIESYGGTQTAENLGEYEVSVHIIATDNAPAAFDKEFTLKYKIVPKVLDFDNADWEWRYKVDDDSEWEPLTDKNMPSYNDGKAVDVHISPDFFTDLGFVEGVDYTVSYQPIGDGNLTEKGEKSTKAIINILNKNYTTADGDNLEVTKEWRITPRALNYRWNATQTIKAGETTFEFAAITFEEEGEYGKYFEYYYTVKGVDGEFTKEELEAYLEENWNETITIEGAVCVRMTGESEDFVIKEGSCSFSTGASKTALAVAVTTNETTAYGDVEFTFTVMKDETDECTKTTVTIAGETFDGSETDKIKAFINTLDAGSYTVTVSVKDENSYTLTGDYSYPLTIAPALLKVKWNSRGTLDKDGDGGYKGSLEGLFTYKYTDADGNEVTELEKGKTYKVVAELNDTKNFTMSEEMSRLISTPYEFELAAESNFFKDNLGIIIGVGGGLLFLLALILLLTRRRKRADDYYDDEYDYDDEDDEDDDDDEDY